MPTAPPRISVLVLSYNGREHLQTCLPTLLAQVYPKSRMSIEVVDNGSTDGTAEFVRATFPDVVVHRIFPNKGFSGAYDEVMRTIDSEWVVFLNNDTRVEPDWLAELASAADRHGADVVASRMLDWDGSRIDFVGGLVSFVGHSWQRRVGEPTGAEEDPERRLLFACGGSMLISRRAYLDAGGFDRDFFAYFEDVDLGWRISLLGYKTVLAPRAITYHRLHGTWSRVAFAQRLRLFERNALAMLYKNYEDETLRAVLPSAIALSLLRGLMHSGIDARTFAHRGALPSTLDVTARAVVHLLALEDFVTELPALRRKRADIQRRRTVPDRELFPLFGEPFRLHDGGRYAEVAQTLIRDFGLEALFDGGARPASVAVAEAPPPAAAPIEIAADLPLVSVIVLTALGPLHLPDCLSSLRAQTYPADRREILVVDNGAPDDPGPVAEEYYPGVRIVRVSPNRGFAGGNNVGARAANGEYLVFLNDDTRVHPDWLRELVETAQRRNAASVGSRILTWNGERIDFVGGSVNIEGKGFQLDIGQPEAGRHTEERPLLFACGGAMLVRRDVFLETGGWDEGAFAYYEDVELGWRFWLLGHEVWFSPQSIVYHKHHGTWGRWPEPPRLRLYERNSLRILYTHLERETLEQVLPAALLLSTDRALLATHLSRANAGAEEQTDAARLARRRRTLRDHAAQLKIALRERGVTRRDSMGANLRKLGVRGLLGAARDAARQGLAAPAGSGRALYEIGRGIRPAELDGRVEPFPTGAAAILSGLDDFLTSLPDLSTRRQMLQSRRRRSDREILAPFSQHWLDPCGAPRQREHNDVQAILLEALGITGLAPGQT